MAMVEAVIVSAVRTAIGKVGGTLTALDPEVYGAEVMKEAVKRAGIQPEDITDIIFGNVLSGGGNIARLTALQAGFPYSVTASTIDRQCGSSLNAINLAAQGILSQTADIVLAGGVESMSRAPYLMERPNPTSMALPRFRTARLSPDFIGDPPMGITAENLVEKYKISREEQDIFALASQQKLKAAQEENRFKDQIVPIQIPQKKGDPIIFDRDEHGRPNTTLEGLAALAPAFKKGGSVTAGNSSGLNDGAGAVVIMSKDKAQALGLKPMAKIRAFAYGGVDPNIMGIGPVPATRKALAIAGLALSDIDLIEANEAFAAQVLAVDRELKFDMDKVNVNGGAIAHGHPLGATGVILTTKLLYEMKRRDVQFGMVTMCIGGGQGVTTIYERI